MGEASKRQSAPLHLERHTVDIRQQPPDLRALDALPFVLRFLQKCDKYRILNAQLALSKNGLKLMGSEIT